MEGGRPAFILAAGYIGSTLFGGLFVLAGWDILVAKIMSFVLGIGMIMPLKLVRDKLCVSFMLIMTMLTALQYYIIDDTLRSVTHRILVY